MNIYIDYLPIEHRNRSDYTKAKRLVNQDDELVEFDNKDLLLEYLNQKDINDVRYISINSHGLPNPACFSNSIRIVDAIGYKEFIEVLNTTIGGVNIILNLIGVCNSFSIEYYLRDLDNKFSEVWVSDCNTTAIDAPFLIIHDGDFDDYIDEKELPFRKIIRHF
jgi:hypothetical protein